jgi:hypothetical protein
VVPTVRRLAPALLLLALAPCHAGDVIRLHNVIDAQSGALVDGVKDHEAVNDERFNAVEMGSLFNSLFPVIPLDEFVAIGSANEILAFAHRRPPELVEDVPWTPARNTIDVTFRDQYLIPVHVWVVQGPFDDVWSVAVDASVTTSMIWATEGQGIAFESFVPHDATNDPDLEPFLDFQCGLDGEAIKTAIGYVPGTVNVYYVNRVDFGSGPSTTSGVWCYGNRIMAMGRNTSDHLLAHEFGHAFSLGHTNGDQNSEHFDSTNVMYNFSSYRRYLTEGQTFRSVFHGQSAINAIYGLRPGEVVRDCSHSDLGVYCPAIYRRVWSDGAAWPPN